MRLSTEYKWRAGDLFFKSDKPKNIYRVHRVKGRDIFYLPSHYGCYPPRGTIWHSRAEETNNWVIVER